MLKFLIIFTSISEIIFLQGELWEKDVTSAMKIGLSTTGYRSVDLKCDPEHFSVNVTLEKDFEGVVYARGSYNDKKSPCFKRHDQNMLQADEKLMISMMIPFNKCHTVMDVAESCYTNTIVIQHDPELIMPGDAAFNLKCAFVPEFKVSSNISTDSSFKSKIILVSADPAEKTDSENENFTIISDTEKVSFVSNSSLTQAKDEL